MPKRWQPHCWQRSRPKKQQKSPWRKLTNFVNTLHFHFPGNEDSPEAAAPVLDAVPLADPVVTAAEPVVLAVLAPSVAAAPAREVEVKK